MNWNKPPYKFIAVCIFAIAVIFFMDDRGWTSHRRKTVDTVEINNVLIPPMASSGITDDAESQDIDPCYGITCLTYHSKLGFSFQYPDHLFVTTDPKDGRLYVMPKSMKESASEPMTAIVISIADNTENMTPEEWMRSPNARYDPTKKYYKTTLGGQDAAYTDGGMWTVVNTPDNKKRLSITYITKGTDILFTEMGVIVNSLKFTELK